MALLASTAKDGRNIRKSSKDYEMDGLARRYLVEAISYAEKAAAKLIKGKVAKQWKLLKATAISEVCPIIDDLIRSGDGAAERGKRRPPRSQMGRHRPPSDLLLYERCARSANLKSKQKFVLQRGSKSGCRMHRTVARSRTGNAIRRLCAAAL